MVFIKNNRTTWVYLSLEEKKRRGKGKERINSFARPQCPPPLWFPIKEATRIYNLQFLLLDLSLCSNAQTHCITNFWQHGKTITVATAQDFYGKKSVKEVCLYLALPMHRWLLPVFVCPVHVVIRQLWVAYNEWRWLLSLLTRGSSASQL